MLSKYKSGIEGYLQRIAKKFSWLHPNLITVVGIVPQILFVFFMSNEQFGWAILMLILAPLDMIDGILARANNKVTKFGGFLDSTMDRIGDFLIIVGLYAGGLSSLSITALLLLLTYLISYARSRAELASNNSIKFDYGIIERPERLLYILIVVVSYTLFPTAGLGTYSLSQILISILVLLSAITFLQRTYQAYKKL